MELNITKGQKRLLIVLGIILLYMVYDIIINSEDYLSFYFGKNKKTTTVKKDVAESRLVVTEDSVVLDVQNWGRDPFVQPKVVQKKVAKKKYTPKATRLVLRAISYQGVNSVALINDQILKVGDRIDGYTIKRIEPKRVILIKGGREKTITL
ncbi:MAG: hypothetical protein GF313_02570 [Caldithrix sp.]|nr:hypothetical protein [Caldithrix sp.]